MDNQKGKDSAATTFIKVKGQEFAFGAVNVVKQDGWIEFDRINTKTGQVVGHYSVPLTNVDSIEERGAEPIFD